MARMHFEEIGVGRMTSTELSCGNSCNSKKLNKINSELLSFNFKLFLLLFGEKIEEKSHTHEMKDKGQSKEH